MAYTNAIFCLDHVLGSDSARATQIGTVFSNPSGDLVMGFYAVHNLETGGIIDVTGCTQAYANSAWKVTKIGADTYYLDGASWALFNGADVTGNVVPRGGQNWIDAWKTFAAGATAARTQPGDTIRMAKSADPVSCGTTADFTNANATITLGGTLTTNIETCETAWTPSANVTCSTDATNYKEGTKAVTHTITAAFTTGLAAYKATVGLLNLSGYTKISFWLKVSVALVTNSLRVDLCSANNGTSPQNSFTINYPLVAGIWYPFTFEYGGALYNGIQSVALTVLIDVGAAGCVVTMDNILACNTALHLQSLIGKNTAGETFWTIKSINGTTVILGAQQQIGATVTPYYGTTETANPLYYRVPIQTTPSPSGANQPIQQVQEGGSVGSMISYIGGWNITTNSRDGETWFDGLIGQGQGIQTSAQTYLNFEYIGGVRYDSIFNLTGCTGGTISNCHACGNNGNGIAASSSVGSYLWAVQNQGTGVQIALSTTSGNLHDHIVSLSNSLGTGLSIGPNSRLTNFISFGNKYGIYGAAYGCSNFYNGAISYNLNTFLSVSGNIVSLLRFYNVNYSNDTAINSQILGYDLYALIDRIGKTANRYMRIYGQGIVSDQITGGQNAAWANGGAGLCIYINPTSTTLPIKYVFHIPVAASIAFALKFYVKKTSAAANCSLTCTVYDTTGDILLNANSVALTDGWVQYSTGNLTPTDNGFCKVELNALDGATTGDIGIDDIIVDPVAKADYGLCEIGVNGSPIPGVIFNNDPGGGETSHAFVGG